MKVVELNVKDLGLRNAIQFSMMSDDVEILVAPSQSLIPLRCDWYVSDKQIKGIAEIVAKVDGKNMFFKWI